MTTGRGAQRGARSPRSRTAVGHRIQRSRAAARGRSARSGRSPAPARLRASLQCLGTDVSDARTFHRSRVAAVGNDCGQAFARASGHAEKDLRRKVDQGIHDRRAAPHSGSPSRRPALSSARSARRSPRARLRRLEPDQCARASSPWCTRSRTSSPPRRSGARYSPPAESRSHHPFRMDRRGDG